MQPVNLPHSAEAEQAVLASVLLSPPKLTVLGAQVGADDFYFEKHRHIWGAFETVAETYGPEAIDLQTVGHALDVDRKLDRVGGLAYLSGLDLELPDLGRADVYAGLVKSYAVTRGLILDQQKSLEDLSRGGRDEQGRTALDRTLDRLEASTRHARLRLAHQKRPRTFAELSLDVMNGCEDRQDRDRMLGLSTGLPDWDLHTQGMVGGELWILAGTPGMGKTSLGVNVGTHVAAVERKPVLMASLEMDAESVAMAAMAKLGRVSRSSLRSSPSAVEEWVRGYDVVRRAMSADWPLWIRDDLSTVGEILATAQHMRDTDGLGLVIVDYLQILRGARRRGESREEQVGGWARELKDLARRLKVPVVVLSQMNRNATRERRKPVLADLRESGQIEQHADGVAFLWAPPRDGGLLAIRQARDVIDDALLIVAKHRSGAGDYEIPLVIQRAICDVACKTLTEADRALGLGAGR